uniref:Beta/gamma crystallin 'Greek key' domain-containing protein n=1 Tax=Pelusios castaneus TaxID=367368 RepID=A0A8C8SZ63_9SAUR
MHRANSEPRVTEPSGHSITLSHFLSQHRGTFRIKIYEKEDHRGNMAEFTEDSSQVMEHQISRCNSIQVESGCFMLYERPNFQGQQFFVKRGEYPDIHLSQLGGCAAFHRGTFRIKIYEKEDHRGNMAEFTEDSSQVMEQFRAHEMQSCTVQEGYWILYELPNYRGRQYLLRPGEYRRYSDWGAMSGKIGSLRRATDTDSY